MEGISLGSAFLRLYGDRSALDRELAVLKRYTDQLEKQGIKVKFDADTGQASRELNSFQNRLHQLQQLLNQVGQGVRGDGDAWKALGENLSGLGAKAAASGGSMGKMAGMLGTAGAAASKAIPVLGQLGMAAMGVQAIFQGLSGAINGVLAPLEQLSAEAGRFNKQVAEAGIFTANTFAIFGEDGKLVEGTANQMRSVRGVITKEYKEIQKEVAKISGATASEIYEGFNIILQNAGNLGKEGQDISKIRNLSTRIAAAMNTLGVPGYQLRSEVNSLMMGNIGPDSMLAKKLGYQSSADVQQLQAQGKFYEDLINKLNKLYDGQTVLANSLANVKSNFQDLSETIASEGGQALERGLAVGLKSVLDTLDNLQDSFMMFVRGANEALEPLLKILGDIAGMFVSVGSIVSSVLAVVMDLAAVVTNLVGVALGPAISGIGKVLQIIAKIIELIAKAVGGILRPLSGIMRVATELAKNSPLLRFFDYILNILGKAGEKLDEFNSKLADAGRGAARRMGEAKAIEAARELSSEGGSRITQNERQKIKIAGEQAVASYNLTVGDNQEIALQSLQYSQSTERFFAELDKKMGASQSDRNLAIAKDIAKIKEDSLRREITGTEQVIKLLQTQKGLQEAMSQLADARRGIAMSRAGFAVQVAGSPEARLAAEERRNELAARQEQERISERKALLGTERQLLQLQLQIQLRQQRIQQEQLKIQRLEIEIQHRSAMRAMAEARDKLAVLRGPELKAGQRRYEDAKREVDIRGRQLQHASAMVSLAFEAESGMRRTNALEQERLGVQGQILDVQGQAANLTLEQQRTMTLLQRQEQDLKNQLTASLKLRNDAIKALQDQIEGLQRQEKAEQRLNELRRARLEASKATADADVQAAERVLRAVQARDNASSARDFLAAQIEAIAAGTRGYLSEAEATRRLYDAKDRQLALEQQMQRDQLQAQQQRERSEQRIYNMQLQIQELQALNLQTEIQFRRAQLGITQQRDAIAGRSSGSALPGAPAAPVLPPPAGGSAFFGRTGRMSLAAGYGMVDVRGSNRAAVMQDAMDIIRANTARGAQTLIGGDMSGDVDATRLTGEQLANAVSRGIDRHANRVSSGTFAIDLISRLGTPVGIPLSGVSDRRGATGVAGMTQRGNLALHLAPNSASGGMAAPAAQVATPSSSLQNDLLQNTTDLVNADRAVDLARQLRAESRQREADQEQRFALANDAQATSQSAQRAQAQADRLRAQLTAEVMNSFKGRLAVSLSDAVTTGMTGAIRGAFAALRNGGSLRDAVDEAMSRAAEQFLENMLSMALKPLQDGMTESILGGVLGGDLKKIEQQVAAQQQAAAQSLETAAQSHQSASQSLQAAAQSLQVAAGSLGAAGAAAGAGTSAGPAAGGLAFPPIPDFATDDGQPADAPEDPNAPKQQEQGKLLKDLNKGFAAATQAVVGVTLAMDGLRRVTESSSTYDTLMGIGSIFMGVGSVLGGIGGLGEKAAGGPVHARQPYLVGEKGPELFYPETFGTVVPNATTAALLANRNALAGKSRSAAADVFAPNHQALSATATLSRERYVERVLSSGASSTEIKYSRVGRGDLPFVTEDDMLQATRLAAEQGARIGQQRTLAALRNDPSARRGIAI